jgi:hypothetical protein
VVSPLEGGKITNGAVTVTTPILGRLAVQFSLSIAPFLGV